MKTSMNALVVDENEEFTSSVVKYFQNNNQINILNVISDGDKALDYILNNQDTIDIILMDLILPNLDGLSILKELKEKNIQKHIIILSSYKKEYTVKMTSHYQVDYFMLKPCNLKSLEDRIKEIFLEIPQDLYADKDINVHVQKKVSDLLHNLGVPSQVKGFQYLREGILMLYQSASLIGGITKEVYPEIACRYNTTPSRVERAIRHAIEISWNRADIEMMNKIFGHSIDYDRAKPTNSEFIVTLSDALRLDEKTLQYA